MPFPTEFFSSSILAFGAIFLAEIGDKSQLVCMTLASKHRSTPVAIGAISAFMLLNIVAVTVGNSLTHFIPHTLITLIAAVLFVLFGVHSLFSNNNENDADNMPTKTSRSIAITTFIMIFVAELGDKTQLAVVTLSTTHMTLAVWVGATLALILTSLLGIYAGRTFLANLNMARLNKASGIFFLVLASLLIADLVAKV